MTLRDRGWGDVFIDLPSFAIAIHNFDNQPRRGTRSSELFPCDSLLSTDKGYEDGFTDEPSLHQH